MCKKVGEEDRERLHLLMGEDGRGGMLSSTSSVPGGEGEIKGRVLQDTTSRGLRG